MKKTILFTGIIIAMLFTLPIVEGANVKDFHVWGSDNIIDYRRGKDTNNVGINVSFGGGEVKTDNVLTADGKNFNSCEPQGNNYYYCKYTGATTEAPGGDARFTVIVKDNSGVETKTQIPYHVDTKGAEVTAISFSENPVGDKNLTITYTAKDYLSESPSSFCAGLKQIEIIGKSGVVKTIDFNKTSVCSWTSKKVTLPAASLGSGTFNLCMRAIDYFDQSLEQKCEQITVIVEGAQANAFYVVSNGVATSYVKGNEPVTFALNLTDTSGLAAENVKANFKSLSGNDYFVSASRCDEAERNYTCYWDNVPININSTGTYPVTFEIKNNIGNVKNISLSILLNIDRTKPVFQGLSTPWYDSDNKYYVREKNTTIKAIFDETGSMFNSRSVYLSYEGTRKRADNCTLNYCEWTIDLTSQDKSKVTFTVSGTDDVGNEIIGSSTYPAKSVTMIVDAKPPKLVGYELKVNGIYSFGNFAAPVLGDELTFIFNFTDTVSPGMTAFGNFTEIGGDISQGECVNDTKNIICTITATVNEEGYEKQKVYFEFYDIVEHKVTDTKEFEIYGVKERNDLWLGYVNDPTPNAIDRDLMPIYNTFQYFPIELKKNSSVKENIWPVKITVDNCVTILKGTDSNNTERYIDTSKYLVNGMPEVIDFNDPYASGDTYKFYLKYTFDVTEWHASYLPINCTINIVTRIEQGKKKYISANQQMIIPVYVLFYKNPNGELAENVVQKINDTLHSWEVKADWLEDAQYILNYAQTVCSMINTLAKIQRTFATLVTSCGICQNLPFIGAACKACVEVSGKAHKTTEEATAKTHTCLGKGNTLKEDIGACFKAMCKLVSCQISYEFGKTESEKSEITSVDRAAQVEFQKEELAWGKEWRKWYLQTISDPKNSIITSLVSTPVPCIPGIIYNLQKYRTIKCQYAICMMNVQSSGIQSNLKVCEEMYSYANCMFISGQVLHAIPFISYLSNIAQTMRSMLANKGSLVSGIIGWVCRTQCAHEGASQLAVGCVACDILNTADLIADLACDLGIKDCPGVWKQYKLPEKADGICDSAIKMAKDLGIYGED